MRINPVKRKLASGGASLGTFIFEFNTSGTARIAAGCGAEFALVDMEHTGWSVESIRRWIATARGTELVPLVRVPATEYHFIARALDVGAAGIMVPMMESAGQAASAVACAKYPPVGRRGAAFGISHDDYSGGDIVDKMRSANDETLMIALIESVAGIANVDAIAATEGLDVLWLGHFDLTCSMGIPGQFDHPRFVESVEKILDACRRHGKTAGFMASDVDAGKRRFAQGFRMLAYGGDLWLYQTALRHGIDELRRSIP
ncbi:MAG: aldolase [Planctomycetes bacterium]|nr:aldolase [Planctomycetota bacterium]